MRYVPTYCIRENSILGKSIVGASGEMLLVQGVQLKKSYLRRLMQRGVAGVYIDDELSEDLEIRNILTDELRIKVVNGIKNAFMDAVKHKSPKMMAARGKEMLSLAEDIVEEILASKSAILNLADIKVYDDYTFFHCLQVAVLSVVLGMGLGYSRSRLVKLAMSALLHDVGKVFIPADIINKEGPLTAEEYEEVKKHSQTGYDYLREQYQIAEVSARGVLDHHERYDGKGYPNGKAGKEISEFGRIIAIADAYDALVSDRPYRKGIFAAEAMEYVLSGSNVMYDPDIVKLMKRKVALFPVGTCVLLSNGATGLVMENYEDFGQRPKLKIFLHQAIPVEPYILDLCNDYSTLDITVIATVAVP